MAEWITAKQFQESGGVEDWRVLQGASTHYPTASFAQDVDLVVVAASLVRRRALASRR